MRPESSAVPTQHLRLHSIPRTVPGRRALRATAEWPARVLRDRRPIAVRRHAARLVRRTLVLTAADVAAVLVIQSLAWAAAASGVLRILDGVPQPFGAAPAVVLLASLLVTGNYSRRERPYRALQLLAAAAIAAAAYLWPVLLHSSGGAVVTVYLLAAGTLWVTLAGERRVAEWFLRAVWPGRRHATPAVLIERVRDEPVSLEAVTTELGGDYRPVATLTLASEATGGDAASLTRLAHLINSAGAEAVIVAAHLPEEGVREVLDVSLSAGCEFLYPARSVQVAGRRPLLVWHGDEPFFELGAPLLTAQALILKRAVDIVGATLAILLLAPFYAVVALAVKLDSPGPVFFRQDRAGLGGKRFRMLKFRTMRVGADAEKARLAHLNRTGDARLFKIPNDPRVTRFGAWLRRWSIDELPQCWNVLVGDMSLVGPRPFFEADLEAYEDHHFRRLDAKPGITGLWQVNGRSDVVDFEEVVRYDREYIEHWSPRLDLKIIGKTIPVLFNRTGAY